MANVGYVRVSSIDQNTERQLDSLKLDKIFIDKCSGKDVNRPQLKLCLEYLREGDTLCVHSMDRLSRSLVDLLALVKNMNDKKIIIKFVKENLEFAGNINPMSELMMNIMGAVAQFERSMILERQREGIAIAKAKGLYKGRKPSLSQDQIIELKNMVAERYSKVEIAKKFKISRKSVYTYLNS